MLKKIYIFAGPNGAGKTTFAMQFLPHQEGIFYFVNADLIASGLSPLAPEMESIQAGKIMLRQIDKLVEEGKSFGFETTLAGKSYLRRIRLWRESGYSIRLFFLSLRSPQMAVERVRKRVSLGGHSIPENVILRRYYSGLDNFPLYCNEVNEWLLYDNSNTKPVLLNAGCNL